jgi:hypothetical protein
VWGGGGGGGCLEGGQFLGREGLQAQGEHEGHAQTFHSSSSLNGAPLWIVFCMSAGGMLSLLRQQQLLSMSLLPCTYPGQYQPRCQLT